MLILNSLNNKSLYINYKYCIKLFTTHIHGDMSSNYLLSASEHSPKFVCILSKNFQKKNNNCSWAWSGRRGNYKSGISLCLLLCKSISICTCERKKSLKVLEKHFSPLLMLPTCYYNLGFL